MMSPFCEKSIADALKYGNAVLKFISPNEANATGGHQTGFYLPKLVGELLTKRPPIIGSNFKHEIRIEWQDGRVTDSTITWYGTNTRSEYRLTKFGREFPYLISDTVGDLLILIQKSSNEFLGYVLDLEEDIEEVIVSLNIQPFQSWATYKDGIARSDDEDECLERQFLEFASKYTDFPQGVVFSDAVHTMLEHCMQEFGRLSPDSRLWKYYQSEYRLFQTVERRVCQHEIARLFKDVDDFLQTASSIMNRRKSRAGRSLENHVDFVLSQANVPHEMQPSIDGNPDMVIPSGEAYLDTGHPVEKILIVGIKTTCKDRWRQVLREGKRVETKHILTLQNGISSNQLTEMHEAGITLIVPEEIQKNYPTNHPLEILSLEKFIDKAKASQQ